MQISPNLNRHTCFSQFKIYSATSLLSFSSQDPTQQERINKWMNPKEGPSYDLNGPEEKALEEYIKSLEYKRGPDGFINDPEPKPE